MIHLVRALAFGWDVILVYSTFVFHSAAIGMCIFSESLHLNDAVNNYTKLRESTIETFVLSSTAENCSEIVCPALSIDSCNIICFSIAIIVALFVVLPIIISRSQNIFHAMGEHGTKFIVSVFIMIDFDYSQEITRSEFQNLSCFDLTQQGQLWTQFNAGKYLNQYDGNAGNSKYYDYFTALDYYDGSPILMVLAPFEAAHQKLMIEAELGSTFLVIIQDLLNVRFSQLITSNILMIVVLLMLKHQMLGSMLYDSLIVVLMRRL